MRLSKGFWLEEFLRSETAARHDIDMTPPPAVIASLQRLCTEILQPLSDKVGDIIVTSGYRPTKLNTLVGGSALSQHVKGEASDIVVTGMSPIDVAQAAIDLNLPYWQLILEFGKWTHISCRSDVVVVPRRQVLTARRENGKTVYLPGLHA